jgi:hypothetical protein
MKKCIKKNPKERGNIINIVNALEFLLNNYKLDYDELLDIIKNILEGLYDY